MDEIDAYRRLVFETAFDYYRARRGSKLCKRLANRYNHYVKALADLSDIHTWEVDSTLPQHSLINRNSDYEFPTKD